MPFQIVCTRARSSDDEESSSNSVMGHHHHSPSWSPKVAARKLAADKLHKIPSFKKLVPHKDKDKDKDKDKEKPLDPLAESMKRRKAAQAASPAPEPAAPEQPAATESAASDKATLAEQGFVPPTPLFKRRIADKETRAAKLSHLASVANGKYPTAGGRLNSTGRPVYHSTVW
ncbi:hypothetical protein AB1Y20_011354 [Prymnesium parvum]|uniref:Ribosome biogenesis protein NOP53 n=1 Tax=Prymnesium parvum TaxID=97485 RepID=A0AB34IMM6_PRYPA